MREYATPVMSASSRGNRSVGIIGSLHEIIVNARNRAQEEHEAALEKTRKETEVMLEKAKADIATEKEKATEAAQADIARLALIAARKIVKTGDAHDAGSSK